MNSIHKIDVFKAADRFYEVLTAEIPGIRGYIDKDRIYIMFTSILMTIDNGELKPSLQEDYLVQLKAGHSKLPLSIEHVAIGKRAFKEAVRAGNKDLTDPEMLRLINSFNRLTDKVLVDVGS